MLMTLHPDRPPSQRGFSLVEMMIAVTVGLVVLAGITQIFATSVGTAADTRKLARVNADLRTAMDLMVHDIQRAGSSFTAVNVLANTVNNTTNPFTLGVNDLRVNEAVAINNVPGTCITFTYDDGNDGVVNTNEPVNQRQDMYAFYLSNGAINKRRDGSTSTANSCNPDLVESITDPDRVTITGLTFTVTEQCLNISGIPPRACATLPLPVATNTLAKARQVTITISGRPVEDTTNTMLRTITNTVRVRNDLVCLKGSEQCP